MTRLYKRAVEVTLARPKPAAFFETDQTNAVVIRDLRVRFRVEKDLSKEPNRAEIEIFNLSEQTRAEFARKPLHVRLVAGYEGSTRQVFVGDLRFADVVRQEANIVTRLQCGDGERAYRRARSNRSYKPGVDKLTVVKEIAKSMGLKIPESVEEAKELKAKFSSGLTLSAPSEREMSRILRSAGMSYSIQDGHLQILRDPDVRPGEAVIVSQETGMVGSPEIAAPTEPGKPPVMSAVTKLDSRIRPGGRVKVVARDVGGVFKVISTVHDGDTHGDPWDTSIEGVQR